MVCRIFETGRRAAPAPGAAAISQEGMVGLLQRVTPVEHQCAQAEMVVAGFESPEHRYFREQGPGHSATSQAQPGASAGSCSVGAHQPGVLRRCRTSAAGSLPGLMRWRSVGVAGSRPETDHQVVDLVEIKQLVGSQVVGGAQAGGQGIPQLIEGITLLGQPGLPGGEIFLVPMCSSSRGAIARLRPPSSAGLAVPAGT